MEFNLVDFLARCGDNCRTREDSRVHSMENKCSSEKGFIAKKINCCRADDNVLVNLELTMSLREIVEHRADGDGRASQRTDLLWEAVDLPVEELAARRRSCESDSDHSSPIAGRVGREQHITQKAISVDTCDKRACGRFRVEVRLGLHLGWPGRRRLACDWQREDTGDRARGALGLGLTRSTVQTAGRTISPTRRNHLLRLADVRAPTEDLLTASWRPMKER